MCKLDKFSRSKSMRAVDEKLIINELGPYWKQKAWVWILAMWLQVVMSVSRHFSTMSNLWWFDSIISSLACFPTRILDGQQNHRVYNQYWLYQCSILILLDMTCSQGIWIKPPDICSWGAWMAWHKTVCLISNTCMLLIISALYTRSTQIYGDLHGQHIKLGVPGFCVDAFRSKISFPMGKLILDLLLAVRKCSCQT